VLIIAESKELKKKDAGSQESAAAKRRARARDPVHFRARVIQDEAGEQEEGAGLNLADALDMDVLREVAEEMPVRIEELTTTLEELNAGLAKSLVQQERRDEERTKAAAADPKLQALKRRQAEETRQAKDAAIKRRKHLEQLELWQKERVATADAQAALLQKIKATRTSKPAPPPPAPRPSGLLSTFLSAAPAAPAEIFGANGQILDAHSRRLAALVDARLDQAK